MGNWPNCVHFKWECTAEIGGSKVVIAYMLQILNKVGFKVAGITSLSILVRCHPVLRPKEKSNKIISLIFLVSLEVCSRIPNWIGVVDNLYVYLGQPMRLSVESGCF